MSDELIEAATEAVLSYWATGGTERKPAIEHQTETASAVVAAIEPLIRERIAQEISKALDWYPVDVFGDDLTHEDWDLIRSTGIPTERVASECYRHAYRLAARIARGDS